MPQGRAGHALAREVIAESHHGEDIMKKTILSGLSLAVVVAGLSLAVVVAIATQAHQKQRSLVIVFSGTAEGETRVIGGDDMECFDVDIIDPESGRKVGNGTSPRAGLFCLKRSGTNA